MNNLNLSKRLETLISMIDDNVTVYDIGCDHAYLDIYLTLYKHNKCIPIDAKKSVVEIAKKNIAKFNLDIEVLLNDGINNLNIPDNALVVIAGMGTRNILKILKDKNVNNVLIQSNDDLPLLRKTISNWGYKIIKEKVVFDNDYYYVFIKITKGFSSYSNEQLLLGPYLMQENSNLVYINYIKYLLKKYKRMIASVPKEFLQSKRELLSNCQILTDYLNAKK